MSGYSTTRKLTWFFSSAQRKNYHFSANKSSHNQYNPFTPLNTEVFKSDVGILACESLDVCKGLTLLLQLSCSRRKLASKCITSLVKLVEKQDYIISYYYTSIHLQQIYNEQHVLSSFPPIWQSWDQKKSSWWAIYRAIVTV